MAKQKKSLTFQKIWEASINTEVTVAFEHVIYRQPLYAQNLRIKAHNAKQYNLNKEACQQTFKKAFANNDG